MKINEFADLSWKEFQASYLTDFSKLPQTSSKKCTNQSTNSKHHFHSSKQKKRQVDWEKEGKVQKVKN